MSDERPLIYIVDDEATVLTSLTVLIQRKLGARARAFHGPAEALDALAGERPDVLITDIVMDGREAGIELLERCRERWPQVPVILMSAVASRGAAIQAVNAGAFHFVEKPFRNAVLANVIRTAIETGSARARAREVVRARGRHARSIRHNHPGALERERAGRALIGQSDGFLECVTLVEQAAQSDATVLLEGESGTGKGKLASHLHQCSARSGRPFVEVNCASLNASMLESQLFGHVRGAFPGADQDQPGLVRAAEGGTLFLDEVSEMATETQARLLRVLESREVLPVGAVQGHPVDVRIVVATTRDLRREVARGAFREDLFWRLNVMQIRVPPLRERQGDIAPLAENALARLHERDPDQIEARALGEDVLRVLDSYSWPGNVRELENAIERAAVVAGGVITPADLPDNLKRNGAAGPAARPVGVMDGHLPTLGVVERAYVEWVLARVGGSHDAAADVLGVPASALRAVLYADGRGSDRRDRAGLGGGSANPSESALDPSPDTRSP